MLKYNLCNEFFLRNQQGSPLEITLLGIALSIDAALATFALSLLHEHESMASKIKNGLIATVTFGVFQALMLWLGSYGGYVFTFSQYGYYFQILIGFIFFGLAVKCFYESFNKDQKIIEWGLLPVFVLGLVTSIDALAAGVSLGTIPAPYLAGIEVGFITFISCSAFYLVGQFFNKIPDKLLLLFAGLIFLFLGGQVFWSIRHIFL